MDRQRRAGRRRGCASEYAGDDRITWLGRISDAEKFARLRGAAVFCAPSLHGESFGVVLIEAMAAGTPVVASGLDGYRNVATDGVDALLVEPGDVDALAAALGTVLDDAHARRLAARRRHRRADDFSMRTLAAEYVAHLPPAPHRRAAGPRSDVDADRRLREPRLGRAPAGERAGSTSVADGSRDIGRDGPRSYTHRP